MFGHDPFEWNITYSAHTPETIVELVFYVENWSSNEELSVGRNQCSHVDAIPTCWTTQNKSISQAGTVTKSCK